MLVAPITFMLGHSDSSLKLCTKEHCNEENPHTRNYPQNLQEANNYQVIPFYPLVGGHLAIERVT